MVHVMTREMFGGRVSPEEIGVEHVNIVSFVERLSEFIQEVLFPDVIVELTQASNIEGESPDFTADFTTVCLVAIVLGSSGGEFGDEVVVIIQLVAHLPQEIPERNIGLAWFACVNDRVSVKVEDSAGVVRGIHRV